MRRRSAATMDERASMHEQIGRGAPTIAVLALSEVEALVTRVLERALAARAETPDYLDAEQAAALLGVSRRSLPQLVRRDGLPVHRVGRLYRFRRDEVIGWLEHRAEEPGAHAGRHRRRLASIR